MGCGLSKDHLGNRALPSRPLDLFPMTKAGRKFITPVNNSESSFKEITMKNWNAFQGDSGANTTCFAVEPLCNAQPPYVEETCCVVNKPSCVCPTCCAPKSSCCKRPFCAPSACRDKLCCSRKLSCEMSSCCASYSCPKSKCRDAFSGCKCSSCAPSSCCVAPTCCMDQKYYYAYNGRYYPIVSERKLQQLTAANRLGDVEGTAIVSGGSAGQEENDKCRLQFTNDDANVGSETYVGRDETGSTHLVTRHTIRQTAYPNDPKQGELYITITQRMPVGSTGATAFPLENANLPDTAYILPRSEATPILSLTSEQKDAFDNNVQPISETLDPNLLQAPDQESRPYSPQFIYMGGGSKKSHQRSPNIRVGKGNRIPVVKVQETRQKSASPCCSRPSKSTCCSVQPSRCCRRDQFVVAQKMPSTAQPAKSVHYDPCSRTVENTTVVEEQVITPSFVEPGTKFLLTFSEPKVKTQLKDDSESPSQAEVPQQVTNNSSPCHNHPIVIKRTNRSYTKTAGEGPLTKEFSMGSTLKPLEGDSVNMTISVEPVSKMINTDFESVESTQPTKHYAINESTATSDSNNLPMNGYGGYSDPKTSTVFTAEVVEPAKGEFLEEWISQSATETLNKASAPKLILSNGHGQDIPKKAIRRSLFDRFRKSDTQTEVPDLKTTAIVSTTNPKPVVQFDDPNETEKMIASETCSTVISTSQTKPIEHHISAVETTHLTCTDAPDESLCPCPEHSEIPVLYSALDSNEQTHYNSFSCPNSHNSDKLDKNDANSALTSLSPFSPEDRPSFKRSLSCSNPDSPKLCKMSPVTRTLTTDELGLAESALNRDWSKLTPPTVPSFLPPIDMNSTVKNSSNSDPNSMLKSGEKCNVSGENANRNAISLPKLNRSAIVSKTGKVQTSRLTSNPVKLLAGKSKNKDYDILYIHPPK